MKQLFQAAAVAALVAFASCDRKEVQPNSPVAVASPQDQTQQLCFGGPGNYRSFAIYNACPASPVTTVSAEWAISPFAAPGAYQAADHCQIELRQGSTVYVLADLNASILSTGGGGTRSVYWQVPSYIPAGNYMFRVVAPAGGSLTNYTTADPYLEGGPIQIANTSAPSPSEGVYFDLNQTTGNGTVYWDPADFGGSGNVRIALKPRLADTYYTFEGQHLNVGYLFPNNGKAKVSMNTFGIPHSIIQLEYDVIVDKPNSAQTLKTLLPAQY